MVVAREDVLDPESEESGAWPRFAPPELDRCLACVREEDGFPHAARGLDPRDGPIVLPEHIEPVVADAEAYRRCRALYRRLESDPPIAETRALDQRAAGQAWSAAGAYRDPPAELEARPLHAGLIAVGGRR